MKKIHYFYVILTGILFGTLTTGGKFLMDKGLSAYGVAIFPLIIATILLLPYTIILIIKERIRFSKRMLLYFLFLSLFGGIVRLAMLIPIELGIPIAIVILLIYTQPLWAILLEKAVLKQSVTKTKIFSIFIVLLGATILVGPTNLKKFNLLGLSISLIGAMAMGAWLLYGRLNGLEKHPPILTTFFYCFFNCSFILIFYLLTRSAFKTNLTFNFFYGNIWFYLVIYAIVSSLIPYLCLYKGLENVSASTSGIILLLEPVCASLIAAFFLNQPLTTNIIIGGILILLSNYFVIKYEMKVSK